RPAPVPVWGRLLGGAVAPPCANGIPHPAEPAAAPASLRQETPGGREDRPSPPVETSSPRHRRSPEGRDRQRAGMREPAVPLMIGRNRRSLHSGRGQCRLPASARLTPMFSVPGRGCEIMPVFSSGQSARQAPGTYRALGSTDLIFACGGGLVAHPGGIVAGV